MIVLGAEDLFQAYWVSIAIILAHSLTHSLNQSINRTADQARSKPLSLSQWYLAFDAWRSRRLDQAACDLSARSLLQLHSASSVCLSLSLALSHSHSLSLNGLMLSFLQIPSRDLAEMVDVL